MFWLRLMRNVRLGPVYPDFLLLNFASITKAREYKYIAPGTGTLVTVMNSLELVVGPSKPE